MAGVIRTGFQALVNALQTAIQDGTLNRVKSIQRGTITINGAATGTATITAVVVAKTSLKMLGFSHAGASAMNNWAPTQIWPRITLTNTTTVTATMGADPAVNVIVSFEAVEYY